MVWLYRQFFWLKCAELFKMVTKMHFQCILSELWATFEYLPHKFIKVYCITGIIIQWCRNCSHNSGFGHYTFFPSVTIEIRTSFFYPLLRAVTHLLLRNISSCPVCSYVHALPLQLHRHCQNLCQLNGLSTRLNKFMISVASYPGHVVHVAWVWG